MSPTRRDLFKIAAGLGLTGIVPTVDQRLAAAELLPQHVSDRAALDPASFADEAQQMIGMHDEFTNEWLGSINPQANTGYQQAREAFIAFTPELQDHPVNFDDPRTAAFWRMEEAMFSFALSSYDVGVRHGAAYEHLRRTVVGELQTCLPCQATGLARDGGGACRHCGGTGTVAHTA